MKKVTVRFLAILFLGFITSCDSSKTPNDPNLIGDEVFNVIRDFNSKSLDSYLSEMISLEELRDLANDPNLITEEKGRNELNSITIEELNELGEKDYNKIKSKGIKYKIDWSKITYLYFTYEIEYDDGAKICEGKTYFSNNGQVYYAKSWSVYNGYGYRLVRIKRVYKK